MARINDINFAVEEDFHGMHIFPLLDGQIFRDNSSTRAVRCVMLKNQAKNLFPPERGFPEHETARAVPF